MSSVIQTSKSLWNPASNLSLEEIIIMNYGRSSETVRMRHNPIGYGFKFGLSVTLAIFFRHFRTLINNHGSVSCSTKVSFHTPLEFLHVCVISFHVVEALRIELCSTQYTWTIFSLLRNCFDFCVKGKSGLEKLSDIMPDVCKVVGGAWKERN